MLIIPYSTALRFNKRPYVTYAVTLLCLLMFYLQINNEAEIDQALNRYCESIYKVDTDKLSLDILSQNKFVCLSTLNHLHERSEHGAFTSLTNELRQDNKNKYSSGDINKIIALLHDHVERFQEVAPGSMLGAFMHFPDELNPIPMITSSLIHGGWGHIIFNLIFFLAFAPAVEVLIDNKRHYFFILIALSFITSLSYSLFVLLSGDSPVPTLGLSGVVMGTMGLSAYLMPQARIRVFVWLIVLVKRFHVPAWVLAAWYIGWDTWDVIVQDSYGGINLISHVSGGIGGFLIGLIWLKKRREETRDDLTEEVEHMKTRRVFGHSLATDNSGRRELENNLTQKQARQDHEKYMSELYRYVTTQRDSEAIALMLRDYEIQSPSVEIFEALFDSAKGWGDSRMLLCLGRLIINLLFEQRKYARALMYVEQCQQVSKEFVLADPANVLLLASIARDNQQYQVAYSLVHDAHRLYGDYLDVEQCQLMEIKMLIADLNRVDEAGKLIKHYLLNAAGNFKIELIALDKLIDDI